MKIVHILIAFSLTIAAHSQTFQKPANTSSLNATNAGALWKAMRPDLARSRTAWTNSLPSRSSLVQSSPTARLARSATEVSSTVTERGPNHLVRQRISSETDASGRVIMRTNRYTELTTGMHVEKNGEYVKADPQIVVDRNGFGVGIQAQHSVRFAPNINSAGSIDLTLLNGNHLRSHVLGISYYDWKNQLSVQIAEIKDSGGEIVGKNQMIYSDAFTGTKADVRYTFKKSGFSQDVIFLEQLNSPADYQLDPETTQIEIWTEFLNPPQTTTRSKEDKIGQRTDAVIDFDSMRIVPGMAFSDEQNRRRTGIPVRKEWGSVGGRTFLIESISYKSALSEIAKLPQRQQAAIKKAPVAVRHAAVKSRPAAGQTLFRQREAKSNVSEKIQVASVLPENKGFVVDYETINYTPGAPDLVLKGDTTYWIPGGVYANNLTIEGGAVIKLGGGGLVCLNVICETDAYRPAVITSPTDHSIGEVIDDIEGLPEIFYPDFGLWVEFEPQIHDIRFRYLGNAIICGTATQPGFIRDCQFVNLGGAAIIASAYGEQSPLTIEVQNCLFNQCPSIFAASYTYINGKNLTIDNVNAIVSGWEGTSFPVTLTNCILANVTALADGFNPIVGGNNGFHESPTFGANPLTSSETPFQTVGSGSHYLKSDSSFREQGTTAVGSGLLNSFKKKTTHPPIEFPRLMSVSGELTLFPQIPRYVSGAPDLGYYYDVLDYSVAAMLLEGGSVTVQPGTAIGTRMESTTEEWWPFSFTSGGFFLREGSTFVARGMPTNPITFVDVQSVQEGETFSALSTFVPFFVPNAANPSPPNMDFRFANFHVSQGWHHFWSGVSWDLLFQLSPDSAMNWSMRDCNLYGGNVLAGNPSQANAFALFGDGLILWDNNLFENVYINLDPTWLTDGGAMNVDLEFRAYNNLMKGGRLFLNPIPATAGDWLFKDNFFDKVAFEFYSDASIEHNYNGYWPRTGGELGTGLFDLEQFAHLIVDFNSPNQYAANDKVLTAAPVYQSTAFGKYYLPTSSSQSGYALRNAGSRTAADAGLAQYTTSTDQTKETGQVDIGLHHVATVSSTSAVPKDPDSDGIPDYVEDFNGNGTVDSFETSPSLAQTDTGIADSVNAKYDDYDLDGDGLVGRIEKAFGTDALVSDNPLGITPAETSPDILTFKFPFDYDFMTDTADVRLSLDGGFGPEFQGSERDVMDDGTLLRWNITFNFPGQHFLQPTIYLKLADFSSGQPITVARGFLLPIETDNAVTFKEFYSDFDNNGATLYAQTYPDTEYSIELLDENEAHLKTITGTASTGVINESWDLIKDDIGQTAFTGDSFTAVFTVTPPSAPPQTHSLGMSQATLGFGEGDFTLAYSWHIPSITGPGNALHRTVQKGAVDPLISVDTSGPLNPNPYKSSFNVFSTPSTSGNPGYISGSTAKNNLLDNLASDQLNPTSGKYTRNFYWYGHGTINEISGGTGMSGTLIHFLDVGNRLGNHFSFNGARKAHPYRFVFLDCCDTGARPLWSRAFGIPETLTFDDLQNNPAKARAFLGWIGQTASMFTDNQCLKYEVTLSFFFSLWQQGFPLNECVDACSQFGSPGAPYDPFHLMNIEQPLGLPVFSVNVGSPIINRHKPGSYKKIYGYPNITRLGFE